MRAMQGVVGTILKRNTHLCYTIFCKYINPNGERSFSQYYIFFKVYSVREIYLNIKILFINIIIRYYLLMSNFHLKDSVMQARRYFALRRSSTVRSQPGGAKDCASL